MAIEIYWKEQLYFTVKVVATLAILFGVVAYAASVEGASAVLLVFGIYAAIIALFLFVKHGLWIGHLRGNAVRVTDTQFQEIHSILQDQVKRLGLWKPPKMYILQAGGALNAFAARFFGSDYIVIFSDILEVAYENGPQAISFIVGHELGHIARRHMTKNWLLFPSVIVPFLHPAYSRACEYTCDNIGRTLCPEGAQKAILILGVGKTLWKRMDPRVFADQSRTERSFWRWFAEILSTHPPLTKRLARCQHLCAFE